MPAKRDPNKPRGRMTGYAYFVQTCREEHKRKHPNESVVFTEFSKKCAKRWKNMTDPEKKPFTDLTEQDRVRYEREMKDYRSMGGDAGGKRKKKKKDPNAPKRPQSAFFLFCADFRAPLKAENPSFSVGEIAKALGKKWSETKPDVKRKYTKQGEVEKEKYNKLMEQYKAGLAAGGGAAKAPVPSKRAKVEQPAAKAASSSDDSDSDSGDSD